MTLLDIKNLTVEFSTRNGLFRAVHGIDISVDEGELLSIVGESGSGKSVSMLAVMGLLPWTAKVTADKMMFDGHDLMTMTARDRSRILGRDMAMIFQEPMTSLNPCFTVKRQIDEVLKRHTSLSKKQRLDRIYELLDMVGIPAPERVLKAYPHQISGGMNQRVMIAMMLSCSPKLMVADEPTTALDVTIQSQILDVLRRLQKEMNMALILITHDMGVVAEMAERVTVQYAGHKVEENDVISLFENPRHPYTHALLNSLPERADGSRRLPAIPGSVPSVHDWPKGCVFHPRCAFAQDKCRQEDPIYTNHVACHFPLDKAAK